MVDKRSSPVDVSRRLDELSPEKRALLLQKLKLKALGAATEQTIPRREDRASYPLSHAQQRMWILSQLEPDSPFYNIALALRLTGQVDVQSLENALNEIIRRHEVLRASFTTQRGAPVQVIAPELRIDLRPEDVSESDGTEALKIVATEARRPFDLSRGPLLRSRLVTLGDGEYLAVLTFHHIITDGWSTGVLVRELAALYEAYAANRSDLAPTELPIQYADYAAWQREQLQGERLKGELNYWKEQLRGIPPMLELPTDRPRPAVQTVNGAVYAFELPDDLAEKLRQLAHDEGATLFQVLLAAYQTLLHRYSNQDDICVGTPIANRTQRELEGLIGFFVNTLVMRSDFSDNPSFRTLLGRLKRQALSAQSHQDLPFEMLVDEVAPQRNMAVTPIFQVMFALEQRDGLGLKLPAVEITPVEAHTGTAKFDMTLFMIEEDKTQLKGSFEYNTDLWFTSTIAHVIACYRTLLEGIVADPECRVGLLPVLTPTEQRRMIFEWNDTATVYPRDRRLHSLFEEQVSLRPEANAVTYGDRTLTYAELNLHANRLANWLQELGVGPEVLVGVYLERGIDMVVALLGIVKSGGAYLPLDTEYPAERLAFMMRDGQAPVLITQADLRSRLPDIGATVICMDADADRLSMRSGDNPATTVQPGNLAYVIYTSGSTGVPKGVSIPQQAIARLVFNTNYIDLQPTDKIGQASNASFDAATFEIWGALLRGAELVGINKELALAPKLFAAFIRESGISTLFLTTALFNHIAAEEPTAFNTLAYLMFGGEAVDPRWVRRVLEYGGPCRLLHVYGPTESTTFASWHPIREVASNATTVPIGRPLSNTQMYVLDHYHRPVPLGVQGELCIGGDGLAVSYLNRPELTAEKFIPNPFDGKTNSRLYRTGDLVRYLPDGSIEFQGRIDHQVKVRGFRIELGEIEATLSRQPQVQQAFVIVRQDAAGEDRVSSSERKIVAYIVPREGVAAPTPAELRAHLKNYLPDYMAPGAFVFLGSLPISPNGKVDRHALPAPDYANAESERHYVAPRSPVERFLREKWQEVLGIERISVTDNFFELGGNSLQAAVLTNRMQEELGASAHVRALFMAPTIADLANYLDEYYPDAIARIAGILPPDPSATQGEAPLGGRSDVPGIAQGEADLQVMGGYTFQEKAKVYAQVDEAKVAQFRAIIPPLPERSETSDQRADRNPPAVFVLSPPRSGSTLLRVMLAGNPQLFAPPELDLLSFNTLAERRAAFSGKYQFWLEGPLKAIMELRKCSADEAEAIMSDFEAQGWSTKQFYRQLQAWIGETVSHSPRYLVDKTPVYPMDANILDRMEQDFADVRYVHLVRHPFATVYSFMEAKLEDVFFRWEHPWSMRELAELVYLVSHRNILSFLQRIPPERQHRVWFEDMVGDAKPVMQGICDFLQIDYHADMIEPYRGDKMTSGIRPGHQMVGDFKFYLRNQIDPKAADRWKRFKKGDTLAPETWDVARRFGYEPPAEENAVVEQPASRLDSSSPMGTVPVGQGQFPVKPRGAGEPVALSFAQERLWFLDQFEPGSPFYNVPAAVRLTGALDVDAMQAALAAIVQRHEVLRTTFKSIDGVATPVISDKIEVALPIVDLRQLPAELREQEALRLAAEEARRPFDLANGPLLRASLLQENDSQYYALITMHHIISDGWSVNVFIKELATLYAKYRLPIQAPWAGASPAPTQVPGASEDASPLPPLPIQYADFAAWQRKWFEGERARQAPGEVPWAGASPAPTLSPLQQQLSYWREQLKGLPPMLELPTDRPRPAVQTLAGERHTFILSEELAGKVKALARREGVTTFMTLLAAFQTLLLRYTGQEDIAVGAPIAGRNRPEIANLIGFFVNTLVLRGDLSGEPSFRQLLHRVQSTAIKAYENQDAPFEMLVEALAPERDMSHSPLFQVMFALQDAPLQAMHAPGLTLTPLQPDTKTAKFDLMLNIVERTDVLRCAIEFNTDLFNASTAIRMAEHLRVLLQAIVTEPDRAITTLPILTEAEQQRMLVGWNDTTTAIDTESTLAARFEEQAARTPNALAVMAPPAVAPGAFDSEHQTDNSINAISYRDLDARAERLAQHLAALGVGPESIVGLMLERSVEMLVGVVGIWKAGGAYVPLDPSYPADRLAFMLADSDARVLVTQSKFVKSSLAAELDGQRDIVVLDDTRDSPTGTAAVRRPGPDNLAYIIYTSGSTGRPKGVAVTHRTALNLAGALHRVAYAREQGGGKPRPYRVSLNAPLAFDASVQQVVMLTLGHTLVVIPQEIRGDAPALLAFIRRRRLDQLDCVPSQLKLLLAEGLLSGKWRPSLIFPGGEAIDEPTWSALAAAPNTTFYNMYGPTECTVDSTTVSPRQAPKRATIGRPLANVRVYVLDRHLQPVAVGVPGELFIAGAGVSRGYINRPDLTAERFMPDPFVHGRGQARAGASPAPTGTRMYRTGDRVRWLPDGTLEFLGRVDFQVKVRGFRIELGEVEESLRKHPAVREAVVLARDGDDGVKRLVGYVVPSESPDVSSPTTADLRQHLLATLPEYMVPSAFMLLNAMPLTPNAKIDRKALLRVAPEDATRAETGGAYEAPTSGPEAVLADIFAKVLGLNRVGANDNFFHLGGDSILTIQVVARAGQAGIHITPRQIFQAPTVAGLALLAQITPAAAVDAEQGLVEGDAPLTPIQHSFFEVGLAKPSHWNQSLLLTVRTRLNPDALRASVGALLRHHDALRLKFTYASGQWQQVGLGMPDAEPFEYVDLSPLEESARGEALREHILRTQQSLGIQDGQLVRVVYFDYGPATTGRLLIVIHHLAIDRVSWRIILEDLSSAYEQATQGGTPQLPLKTSAFRDWARRLAEYAQSPALKAEASYWLGRGQVAPVQSAGNHPLGTFDWPTGSNTEADAATAAVFLDEGETASLLQDVGAAYGADVKEVLLTALALAFQHWTGQSQMLLQIEGHGRQEEPVANAPVAAGVGAGLPRPGTVQTGSINLARTVGWFTTIYPTLLALQPAMELGDALKAVKEQMRAVPNGGIGFGVLRYLVEDESLAAQMAALPRPQVSFNHLGQFIQATQTIGAFGPAPETSGPDRAAENTRHYALDVTTSITRGQLRAEFTYSEAQFAADTIEMLADVFIQRLKDLIEHCLSPEAGGYTASDFAEAGLSEKGIQDLLLELGEIDRAA